MLDALLDRIVDSGRWSNNGPLVRQLEDLICSDLGWRQIAATSSGTSALTVALLALELPENAEVVTSPLTFPATVQAIEAAGLAPVFAGVDPVTLCLDPEAVWAAIGPRTAAILPVHLFGVAADPVLDEVGLRAGLPVVYDAAHAYGFAPITGRGASTAYSLHATKLLHTGEGGAVATDDLVLAERLRRARSFGLNGDHVVAPGCNAKMAEPAAALGLAVLPKVAAELAARQRLRDAYSEALDGAPRCWAHAAGHARGLVMEAVRCPAERQQGLLEELAARGVVARRFPALTSPGQRYADVALVGADRGDLAGLADSVVALPLHGRVPDAALEVITDALRS